MTLYKATYPQIDIEKFFLLCNLMTQNILPNDSNYKKIGCFRLILNNAQTR